MEESFKNGTGGEKKTAQRESEEIKGKFSVSTR
jgi:hypothetical protein